MMLNKINFLLLGLTPLVIAPIATTSCTAKTMSLNDKSIVKDLGRIKDPSHSNILNEFLKRNPDLQITNEKELDISAIYYNQTYIKINQGFWKTSKYGKSGTVVHYDSYIWPLYDYEKTMYLTAEQPKTTFEFAITKDFSLEKFDKFETWEYPWDDTSNDNRYLNITKEIDEIKNILIVNIEIKEDKLKEKQKTWINFLIKNDESTIVNLPRTQISIN